MDDLEKAILFTFDQTGAVDLGLKARAQSYLEEIKRNSDSWRLCLSRFPTSRYVEVKFWCLQTLQEAIRAQYVGQHLDARLLMKQTLIEWLRQTGSADWPVFLRNKLAQIIVSIVQIEFPVGWPSFFHDLLGMLSEGPSLVDMFCRILTAVDEDIISLEINRPQEELKQSMQLKDAMRETCLPDLADAWTGLIAAYHSLNPELTASLLAVIERYISWIDIGLVANDKFVPLLFSVMATPSEQLRGAVVDVVTEVVSKRMDPVPKLALIQGLGIIPTCCQWASSPPYQEDQEELGQKFARLLNALATELLESWKKVDNQVTSLRAVGLAVDAEASKEAAAACDAAQRLLDDLFPAILATLSSPVEGVPITILPFLTAYVNKLKRTSSLPQPTVQHLKATMEGLASCARFPSQAALLGDSDQDEDGPGGSSSAELDEDDEVAHLSKRTELFTLFRNIVKLLPEQAYSFVEAQLQGVLGSSNAAYQDMEVAISLLYQLGEGASEEALKAETGAVGRLALGLMQVDIPCMSHRLVATALMEAYMRYARVLQSEPGQACLPRVLGVFLGPCGIGHPHEGVSTRACYLFCRLVRQVRGNLVSRPGLIHSILASLQPHLSAIATEPQVGTGTLKAASAVRPHHAGEASAADDRLYTFEAVGQLLGQEELDADEQLAYLSALLQPLLRQIDSNLPGGAGMLKGGGAASGPAEDRRALLVVQALEAITRLSKGLPSALVTRTRPKLGALLMEATEKAQRVPQLLPGNKLLRARYISFLHRMVEVLGVSLMGYLAPALEALLQPAADAQDVCEVIILLNQLMIRFKEALQPLLLKALPVCLKLVHSLLPNDWDWSGRSFTPTAANGMRTAATASATTEDSRERSELQKTYYILLHTLSYNGLSSILVQTQPPLLDTALEALVRGAATSVDPATRRTCVQVLRQLVMNMEASSGLRRYLEERIAGEVCIRGLFQGGLDVRDAATSSLLLDVAQLLKLLHEKCGDELLTYLGQHVLPSLGAAPTLQEQLGQHLKSSDAKQLKIWLRSAMQQSSGLPISSSAASRNKAMAASAANGSMLA